MLDSPKYRIRWTGRLAERFLLTLGLLLLTTYGAVMMLRFAAARTSISEFENDKPQAAKDGDVDFSLWSERRIREFQRSLTRIQGEPLAVLSIARLRIKAPVFAGTDELVLNRGVGWIDGTPRPGAAGNSGIAGHRDGFFRALKDITVGDSVELHTPSARLTYRVENIEIVRPEDVSVLLPRGAPSLTLVTCFPFYFVGEAPQRFIVHAKLEKQIQSSAKED